MTGNTPGMPRQTGHTCELGGAPNRVLHPQKSFDFVSSWTWTSSPTTIWYGKAIGEPRNAKAYGWSIPEQVGDRILKSGDHVRNRQRVGRAEDLSGLVDAMGSDCLNGR